MYLCILNTKVFKDYGIMYGSTLPPRNPIQDPHYVAITLKYDILRLITNENHDNVRRTIEEIVEIQHLESPLLNV